jgi:hypothetical protein
MGFFRRKVAPASKKPDHEHEDTRNKEDVKKDDTDDAPLAMFVILRHALLKLYGAQRHPHLDSFETLK